MEFRATRDAQHASRKTSEADPYQAILEAYDGAFEGRTSGAGQTGDDVARTILEAATADAPHLRYQTSDFARGMAAQVRIDPTGDAILKQTSGLLGG